MIDSSELVPALRPVVADLERLGDILAKWNAQPPEIGKLFRNYYYCRQRKIAILCPTAKSRRVFFRSDVHVIRSPLPLPMDRHPLFIF